MTKPPTITLHQKLREQMLRIIRDQPANAPLDSERELAKHFGVARGTMEKVMRELQLEGWVTRQVGRGTFVSGRDQEGLSDSGPVQSGRSVVLACPDFFSHFLWSLVHAADGICHRHGVELQRLTLQPLTTYESLIRILDSRPEVQGAVVMYPGPTVPRRVLRALDACGKPVVMLSRLEENGFQNISYVATDDFMIGYLKADCLLQNGHERIGYVRNEPEVPAMIRQAEGVRTAFQDRGVALRHLRESARDVHHWEYTGKAASEMTKALLEAEPAVTGLITDSMPGGFGALRALYELGLRCPDDVSVVTSMAHAGFEELTAPALSSVVCSPELHMQKAIDIVVDPACQHERAISIGAELIERESVRDLTAGSESIDMSSVSTHSKR